MKNKNNVNLNNCTEWEYFAKLAEEEYDSYKEIDFEEEVDFIHYQTGLDRDIVFSVLLSDMNYLRFKGILPEDCDCCDCE